MTSKKPFTTPLRRLDKMPRKRHCLAMKAWQTDPTEKFFVEIWQNGRIT
jgi:hypothetical protein